VSCAKGRLAESKPYQAIQLPREWSQLMLFGDAFSFFGFSFFLGAAISVAEAT